MSTLAVILIVVGVLALVFLVGGFIAARRWREAHAHEIDQHIVEADRALEDARAADKGWDRELLEAAAREAVQSHRPGWAYDELALVLVDDRPGITEDRAHFVASGNGDKVRVVLARNDRGWAVEQVH